MTTEPLSYILPDSAVKKLQRSGKAYAREERRRSRRAWYFGAMVNYIWGNLPTEVKEEIRLSDFYAECSQWINYELPFPVVSASGETLRRWCDVVNHYKTFPAVTVWQDVLSFDHFDKARSIGADPFSGVTSSEALAFAVAHDMTADEMKAEFTSKNTDAPEVIENRLRFAKWLGRIPDVLLSMNGNRSQAEYHLGEFTRLVEEDRNK